jgi:hypothetical protein
MPSFDESMGWTFRTFSNHQLAITKGFPSRQSTPVQLPKLDVTGSIPVARFA